MALVIDQIKYGSHTHDQAVDLRRRVLRTPLGLDFTAEQLEAEAHDIHIAAFVDGFLAGTVLLADGGGDIFKLRQMALAPEYEGQKVGATLLRHAERVARARGRSVIELNARTSAEPFYARYGYRPEGAVFTQVTLPHIHMTKAL